jgi:hypothetical protein
VEPGLRPGLWGARKNPRPRILAEAQILSNRIQSDIGRFFLQLLLIADSVIEVVALPANAKTFDLIALPGTNDASHILIVRENEQRVQMIGHEQK